MKRLPPPVIALGAALTQRAMTREAPPSPRARSLAAAAVATASIALAGSAAGQFRRQGTTVDPIDPSRASALVTSGPNGLTRNPMYVGMAGLLVAHALRRGSLLTLLPVAAFTAYIDRVQIAAEERALAERFGSEYDAYRRRVPRWLGPTRTAEGIDY
jgi:protein-S-isoprenylcysteine O-methyltransferase Ste14